MSRTNTQTDRTNYEAQVDTRQRVKEPVEARQGTRPSTTVAVLIISLALAGLAAVVLASVFSF